MNYLISSADTDQCSDFARTYLYASGSQVSLKSRGLNMSEPWQGHKMFEMSFGKPVGLLL